MGQGGLLRRDQSTEESLAVRVNDTNPDEELTRALTSELGPLASGAVPGIAGVSAAGQKALAESLTKSECEAAPKKAPKPKKVKEDPPIEALPKETHEIAAARAPEVLKTATEARKFSISLQDLQYAGELTNKLMVFSNRMEEIYRQLQKHLAAGETAAHCYTQLLKEIDEKDAWYKQAEASSHFLDCWSNRFTSPVTNASRVFTLIFKGDMLDRDLVLWL